MFYSTGDRASNFTDTYSQQEGWLERYLGRPAPARESADVSRFLAQRKLEINLWV